MRTSLTHYIAPSAISITPNANNSQRDLAVYVARGAKIKVYSVPIFSLGTWNGDYQEWTLAGRNRRMEDTTGTVPYTIYARLRKVTDYSDTANISAAQSDGYIVFARQTQDEGTGEWSDPYILSPNTSCYGGTHGTGNDGKIYSWGPIPARQAADGRSDYWWVKIGTVSEVKESGQRTVTLDTGILGTDQYNEEWQTNPDLLPLRIELGCTINDEDVSLNPYVYWGQSLVLTAMLMEGWTGTDIQRFDHWTITRNTGDSEADYAWNHPYDTDSSISDEEPALRLMPNGQITLSHSRTADDFNGAVAATFTVTAWGEKEETDSSSSSEYSDSSSSSDDEELVVLKTATITILAETWEKYEMALSTNIASYNPQTGNYSPAEGIRATVRATDQRNNVYEMTRGDLNTAILAVEYAVVGSDEWTPLQFTGAATAVAAATIPISAFAAQQSVNVRIVRVFASASDSSDSSDDSISSDGDTETRIELYRTTIAFVRDGEDSKVREWIYTRRTAATTFSGSTGADALPSLITLGEVNPSGVANGNTIYDDTLDEWVPNGWTDDPQGIEESMPYEYGAYRDYISEYGGSSSDDSSSSSDESSGGHWGPFSTPRIWNHYGKNGENSIRLALDNEHEDFIYNDAGDNKSGSATSQARLYDGASQVAASSVGWSVSANDGTNWVAAGSSTTGSNQNDTAYAGISAAGLLTVSGLKTDTAKVKVRAKYPNDSTGKYYYADFTGNKTSQDKYDLVVKPNAIAFNSSEAWTNKTITLSADRTDIQGNKTAGVTIQTGETDGLRLYYSYVNADGSLADLNRMTATTFSLDQTNANAYAGIYFELRLYSGSSYRLCDYETVEIARSANGANAYNTAIVPLYLRQKGSVTAPTTGPSLTLYYKFSTHKLYTDATCTTEFTTSTTNGGGWDMALPASEAGKKIYVTYATAYAQGDTDDIASTEWSGPVLHDENVLTQTVRIFKRSASAPVETPASSKDAPADGAVYTFATDILTGTLNGWSTAYPATDGNPVYERHATAAADAAATYDTINRSEWSAAVKWQEDGADGQDMRENLIDGSQGPKSFNVTDATANANGYRYYSLPMTYDPDRIPDDGTKMSGQARITLQDCVFSGTPHVLLYTASLVNGSGASWPTVSELYPNADGTYDVKKEGVVLNSDAETTDTGTNGIYNGNVGLRLDNFTSGTVIVERVKWEVGEKCSTWCLSENDKAVKVLDIDNEMDTVPTDSTGMITAARTIETTVHLYQGAAEVDISTATMTVNGAPASAIAPLTQTANGNGKKLSWAFEAGQTMADKYDIAISYTYKSVTYRATFTVTASKGQAIYQLKPSMSSIAFARNANGAFVSSGKTLTLKVVKTDTGVETEMEAADYGLAGIRYSFDGMPTDIASGSQWEGNGGITVENSRENVYIALFSGSGVLMDRETVPIVKDGAKGATGDSPWIADLDNEMDSVACDVSGKPTSNQTVSTNVSLYYGSEPKEFSIGCYSNAACTQAITNSQMPTRGLAVWWTTGSHAQNKVNVGVTTALTISGKTTIYIKLTATDDQSVYRVLSFVVNGVRPGANGTPATLYKLITSDSQVVLHSDGTYSPNSISLSATQQTGSDAPVAYDGDVNVYVDDFTLGDYDQSLTNNIVLTPSTITDPDDLIFSDKARIELLDPDGNVVDVETIRIVKDGVSQPYYTEVQEAWSEYTTSSSATTPPSDLTLDGSWSSGTPTKPAGKEYLWRRSRQMTLNTSTRTYTAGTWTYVRLSGTNGTSIDVKGSVATVADLSNISNPQDGDAYVCTADDHLYMWSNEASNWVDIGRFKGDPGVTYYTHIAWATDVQFFNGVVSNVDGFTIGISSSSVSYPWMGVLVNTSSTTDSTDTYDYDWNKVEGKPGRGYSSGREYYAVGSSQSASPDGKPSASTYASVSAFEAALNHAGGTSGGASISPAIWRQTRPSYTAANGYLWNFEMSIFSDGTVEVTPSLCIGNLAKGIASVTEYYALSQYGEPNIEGADYPNDISDPADGDEEMGDDFSEPQWWSEDLTNRAPTNERPYQWNWTHTAYNNGDADDFYHVSAVKGSDGKNSVKVDLDNEYEDFLYNDAGTRISSSVTSQARLYDGPDEKTSQATWSISDNGGQTWVSAGASTSTNATASISGSGLLTVTGLIANGVKIKVRALFGGTYYYAEFAGNKVSQDKYSLVLTPSSISCNPAVYETNTITISARRLDLQGNITDIGFGAYNNPSKISTNGSRGYLRLVAAWVTGGVIGTKNSQFTNTFYVSLEDALVYDGVYFELRKYASPTAGNDTTYTVVDYETVPITKAANGANAPYNVYAYARYDSRSANATTGAPTGNIDPNVGWVSKAPAPTTDYPYIWQRIMSYSGDGELQGTSYICMTGPDGGTGNQGHTGRWYEYAGEYDNGLASTLSNTDDHGWFAKRGNYFFMLIADSDTEVSTSTIPTSAASNSNWEYMGGDRQYYIAKAFFGDYAHFGSFIINGDWMISQYGTLNGTTYDSNNGLNYGTVAAYTYFDGAYPLGTRNLGISASGITGTSQTQRGASFTLTKGGSRLVKVTGRVNTSGATMSVGLFTTAGASISSAQTITSTSDVSLLFAFSADSDTACCIKAWMSSSSSAYQGTITSVTVETFAPNFAVDGLTGKTYQNDAYIRGEVHATSGEFTGTVRANNLYHGVCIVGQEEYRYCTQSFLTTYSSEEWIGNFTLGNYYTEAQARALSGDDVGVESMTPCTYAADIAIVPNRYNNSNTRYVYLPCAEDFEGKIVEVIDNAYTNGQTMGNIVVRAVDGGDFGSGIWSSGVERLNDNAVVNAGSKCRFYSIYSNNTWYWLKLD